MDNRILKTVNVVFQIDDSDIERQEKSLQSIVEKFKYRFISWKIVDLCKDGENSRRILEMLQSHDLDYQFIKTASGSYGETLNTALNRAFSDSPIVYIADNKKEFIKELDISLFVKILQIDQNVVSITIDPVEKTSRSKTKYRVMESITRLDNQNEKVLNLHSQLIHRRLIDNTGLGDCILNCSNSDELEKKMNSGLNKSNQSQNVVLTPEFIKYGNFIYLTSILVDNKNISVSNSTPCVTVVITTHNRTNVAKAAIQSLITNLKYPTIKWCISDDRSETGHVESLLNVFSDNGITDVKVCRTNQEHFGLGASMNNGLRYSFCNSDIVLTTEDDWILQKELDLSNYVNLITRETNIAAIRLATMNYAITEPSIYKGFLNVRSDNKLKTSVFNNQVALRHKRVYDQIGMYLDNCSGDQSEQDMIRRFNKSDFIVLYPYFIKTNCMDDPSMLFVHIGKSTMGHSYDIPDRYKHVYIKDYDSYNFFKEFHTGKSSAIDLLKLLTYNYVSNVVGTGYENENKYVNGVVRVLCEFYKEPNVDKWVYRNINKFDIFTHKVDPELSNMLRRLTYREYNKNKTLNIISNERIFHKKNIWVVYGQLNSKDTESIDSWTLFTYLQEHNIPSRYVVWKCNKLSKKIANEKDVIFLDGDGQDFEFVTKLKSILPYVKNVITENAALNHVIRLWLRNERDLNFIFLQHGVTFQGNAVAKLADSVFNYINVFSKREMTHIKNGMTNKSQMNNFVIGGLPRCDRLININQKEPPTILVMPTWRYSFCNTSWKNINGRDIQYFMNTVYYKELEKFFRSRFIQQLVNSGIQIVYAPHHRFTNTIKDFKVNFPVKIISTDEISYWIQQSKMCITDFSSIAFDFLFQQKPVIYWFLDKNDSSLNINIHDDGMKVINSYNFMKNNLFNVAVNQKELQYLVQYYVKNNFILEPWKKAIADTFFDNSCDISKTLVDEITKLN